MHWWKCLKMPTIQKQEPFMKKYKENGFVSAQILARELAQELEMEPDEIIFPAATSLRRRKVPKQFDYESIDESLTDAKEKYRVDFFNVLLDQAVTSLTARFEQMERHFGLFGFLYNIKKDYRIRPKRFDEMLYGFEYCAHRCIWFRY